MTETANESPQQESTPRGRGLHDLSAAKLSSAYAAGTLTPVEVAEAVLERILEREPELNAFYRCDPQDVLRQARDSAERWRTGAPRSAYDGVPCTLKENISRAGIPKPSGTALPNPPVPAANAPVTDRLLEAGVVILGSTTMPDWGMLSSGVSSLHGVSRSAWNPAWTTGGSSAGAGSAAAAGYGPLHVGTDIGGSIRLPGTWQGLATLKPSAGLIPLDAPYTGRAAGPLARTVADAAVLMELVARPDPRDYSTRPFPPQRWSAEPADPAPLRVALQLDAGCGQAPDPEVLAAVQAAAALFEQAGAVVEPLAPFIDEDMLRGLDDFWRTRSYADLEELAPGHREMVLDYIVRWCSRGADVSGSQTIRDFHSIARMQQATALAVAPYDVVLSPVAPMAAFPAEQPMPVPDPERTMAHIGFTVPYNMSGHPAATVNCGFTSDGRPVGLQLAGAVGSDAKLLRVAAWYEAARPESAAPDWTALA